MKKKFFLWWEPLGFTLFAPLIYNIQSRYLYSSYLHNTLIFTPGSLYLLTVFIQYPFLRPPPLVTTNLITFCEFGWLIGWFWGIMDQQRSVRSCNVTLWFHISICFKMITTASLVSVCPCTKILMAVDRIPHTVRFTPMTSLFCGWKSELLVAFTCFFPPGVYVYSTRSCAINSPTVDVYIGRQRKENERSTQPAITRLIYPGDNDPWKPLLFWGETD